MSASALSEPPVIDADEKRLNETGYQQELKRGMGGFSNFAVSFTIISIITGVLQTFWLGLIAGGPRIMIIDWIVASAFIMMVGLSRAEISSAYPTAGGRYYWSARLARTRARRGCGKPADSTCSVRWPSRPASTSAWPTSSASSSS